MWCLPHIVPYCKAIDLFTYQSGRTNYCLCNETFMLICTVISPCSVYIWAHLLSCAADSFACQPAALNQSRVLFDWSVKVQAHYADAFLLSISAAAAVTCHSNCVSSWLWCRFPNKLFSASFSFKLLNCYSAVVNRTNWAACLLFFLCSLRTILA